MSHIWTCECDFAHCKMVTTHRHKKPGDLYFIPRTKPATCIHAVTDPDWKCKLIYIEPEKSSNILSAAWSPFQGGRLFMNFKNGGHYVYLGVPWAFFNDMTIAPSWGKFLNKEIKKNYEYVELSAQYEFDTDAPDYLAVSADADPEDGWEF